MTRFGGDNQFSGAFLLGLPFPGAGVPFLAAIKALHELFRSHGADYAIIGGVAVVRSGSSRTTGDVELLCRREEWIKISEIAGSRIFEFGPDWARHVESGTPVDILFFGDDWDIPFLLPDPGTIREWDDEIGAWFMEPARLLELKAAVYRSKEREYGMATAARDLADVAALLRSNPDLCQDEWIETLHPSVQEIVRSAAKEVRSFKPKRPKRGS